MSDRNLTDRQRDAIMWCAGLRSGEYKQIKGMYFGNYNEACAVGVYLSEALARQRDPKINIEDELVSAVLRMNDCGNNNFEQIADYIEQKVLADVKLDV